MVKKMKDDAIIMHPLPRVDEIPVDVDSTKQARYFKQAEYGKYTRAALLGLILNENGFRIQLVNTIFLFYAIFLKLKMLFLNVVIG